MMRNAAVGLLLVAGLSGCLYGSGSGEYSPSSCAGGGVELTLSCGFTATLVADSVGRARHLAVAPNGDVFVAISGTQQRQGGVLALRDRDGDGQYETQVRFAEGSPNDLAVRDNLLYVAIGNAVVRYRLPPGQLTPTGPADTIVRQLPTGGHGAKSIALGRGNDLFVKVGSRTNSCQVTDRQARIPGVDPCTELETRAGIWLFDANKLNQLQSDAPRYATGLRNAEAITFAPDGALYALPHGRDGLQAPPVGQWTFSNEYGAENPAEVFVRVNRGDDYGWPYCYYSTEEKKQVLAPEYGGDGKQTGRCSEKKSPLFAFPAHWAPNGVVIYNGRQFPERYRGGAFVAFHGSWNRAPLPQGGFNVVFLPMRGGNPAGNYEVFADNFAPNKRNAESRPVGLAVTPDGALLVTDDVRGRIYRISYGR